jgi:hypothetical protein
MQKRLLPLILLATIGVLAGLRCGSDKGSNPDTPTYGIIPDSVTLDVSSSQQFEVIFEGETPDVAWSVNGVVGGTTETGFITQDGLYIAPDGVPQGGMVSLKATPILDPAFAESAKVVLFKDGATPYITITPGDTAVAVTDSVEFSSDVFGCTSGEVVWSIAPGSGAGSDIGSIGADGIYVAPASSQADFALMVMAESQSCLDKTGIASIVVRIPSDFFVELETFTDSSGVGIDRSASCGGGLGVTGLNVPGEWISVPVEISVGGKYTAQIRYAAGYRDTMEVTVAMEGCGKGGASPMATFMLDSGDGVGG